MNDINPQNLPWKSMPVKGFAGKGLLEHANGGIKLVKIAPHSSYPLHQHPEKTEYAFVLEGELGATIGEETYHGGPGMFFQFPVGVKHALSNSGDVDTVVLVGAIQETK